MELLPTVTTHLLPNEIMRKISDMVIADQRPELVLILKDIVTYGFFELRLGIIIPYMPYAELLQISICYDTEVRSTVQVSQISKIINSIENKTPNEICLYYMTKYFKTDGLNHHLGGCPLPFDCVNTFINLRTALIYCISEANLRTSKK